MALKATLNHSGNRHMDGLRLRQATLAWRGITVTERSTLHASAASILSTVMNTQLIKDALSAGSRLDVTAIASADARILSGIHLLITFRILCGAITASYTVYRAPAHCAPPMVEASTSTSIRGLPSTKASVTSASSQSQNVTSATAPVTASAREAFTAVLFSALELWPCGRSSIAWPCSSSSSAGTTSISSSWPNSYVEWKFNDSSRRRLSCSGSSRTNSWSRSNKQKGCLISFQIHRHHIFQSHRHRRPCHRRRHLRGRHRCRAWRRPLLCPRFFYRHRCCNQYRRSRLQG